MMTKFQKVVFWRFLISGTLAEIIGFYFLIHPANPYTGWIFFIIGIGSLLFALWWRNYAIDKNKKENKQ